MSARPYPLSWWLAMACVSVAGAVAVVCQPAEATCQDDFKFRQDKQKHFAGSGVISGTVAHVTDSNTAGFLTSAAIGAAIEISDSKRDKCGSWQDFAYDLAGAALGLATNHWFIGPNRIIFKKEW